jgi:protoheme IX farnesyltransferase
MNTNFISKASAFFELTKPGITRMVLVTTAAGFYLAGGGAFVMLLHTLFGTALAASGTNALNQWVERDADAKMRRTAQRPLPAGRLSSLEALAFATLISLLGLAYLLVFVNPVTAFVVAFTLTSYVFVYTPLKRRTWLSTLVGAVPGALPIVAGWTATGQSINAVAVALFGIMFVWQMPHFFALAWIYREDYGRAGFQMLTVVDRSGVRAARQGVWFAAGLLPISLLPTLLGLTGAAYFVGAAMLGFVFFGLALVMHVKGPSERLAVRLFTASIIYLPVLLGLMVLDKI